MTVEICIYRTTCWFYNKADKSQLYRILRTGYCNAGPERCEINRRYLAGKPPSANLLPDGTMEA